MIELYAISFFFKLYSLCVITSFPLQFLVLDVVLHLMQVHKGRLEESEARKYFQQLVDAISHCHCKGVYHRDLKVLFIFFLLFLEHFYLYPRL